MHWYNVEHHHSGIGYVSPAPRHASEDVAILVAWDVLYNEAKARHPARWSGSTRDWTAIGAATLNPERDAVLAAYSAGTNKQLLAA